MGCYTRLLTSYPYILIIIDIILVVICGPIAIYYHGIPTFDDPREGFEARGTEIRGREQTAFEFQRRLVSGNFTVLPADASSLGQGMEEIRGERTRRDMNINNTCLSEPIVFDFENKLPRMVVQGTKKDADLFSAEYLKAICSLEEKYVRNHFRGGCPAHSLPFYVSHLSNTTCSKLSESNVRTAKDILKSCAGFYFSGQLAQCHTTKNCSGIPDQCVQQQIIYKIFTFFTDINFMKDGDVSKQRLTFSQIIFRSSWLSPEKQLSDVSDYYLTHLDNVNVVSDDGLVESRAMDLLIEILVFNDYVISDLPYYALAMFLVLIVIVLYMRSVVLTLVILLVVAFTILTGYFFYFVVFKFPFFPFINILAGLLCIAVGADDVFILRDIWNSFLVDKEGVENDLEKIVSMTLKHGALSIFVTSLTTAAALYANYVSDITSLKCFSVFAGTCILLNFFFMITFVPPIMVLLSKCKADCFNRCDGDKISSFSKKVWGGFFPKTIITLRYVWSILFLFLGVAGLVLVFYKPALLLPTSKDMKIFYPEHHFEVYRDNMREQFRFELQLQSILEYNINIQFMWGFKPVDTGNWVDPKDNGTLLPDDEFDVSSKEAQIWMKEFCQKLISQDFITGTTKTECFFERFEKAVTATCPNSSMNISPCCNASFPLDSKTAKLCLHNPLFLTNMHVSAEKDGKTLLGMPVYEAGGKKMNAFTFILPTTRTWTTLYNVMDEFFRQVEDFVLAATARAPRGVNNGWWCGARGDLFYYNLQNSLSGGTYVGMGVSLAVGCVVLLLTSMNLLITVYSIISITFTISTTVGILVLLGWELGFFESITITLAVGLSIDFTIHYGVAYLVSDEETRNSKVKEALLKVGAAVAMASLTTFVAGAAVMGGRVLGYRNFGVFLMIVMTVSWAFATFFFLSLCAMIGPVGKCGSLTHLLRCGSCCRSRSDKANGIGMNAIPNGQVIVAANGKMPRNSFEAVPPPRNSFSRPSYFAPLKDESSFKEIARPSRLAHHNMNSSESIFNSNERDNDVDEIDAKDEKLPSSESASNLWRRPPSPTDADNEVDIDWKGDVGFKRPVHLSQSTEVML